MALIERTVDSGCKLRLIQFKLLLNNIQLPITSLDFVIKASLISPRVAFSDTPRTSYNVGFLDGLQEMQH